MSSIITNALHDRHAAFPISFYTVSEYKRQETIHRPNGILSIHQILIILDGNGYVSCCNQTHHLHRGCAFYSAPNTPIDYVNEGGLISAFLTVCGDTADLLSRTFAPEGFLFCESIDTERSLKILREIISEYHNDCSIAKLSSLSYAFFTLFFEQCQDNNDDILNKVVSFIDKNFNRRLTLHQLSKVSCSSVSKLCHDFKNKYGISVFAYIMERRLKHAKSMLSLFPSMPLHEICGSCGFSDVSYFCKAYKSKYGITPSMQRQEKRSD